MALNTRTNTTTGTGSGNAAIIECGDGRTVASVGWDTSSSANISVEVSDDKNTWFDRTHDVVSSQPGTSEKKSESFQTGFRFVRAYADSSLNSLTVSAKGS